MYVCIYIYIYVDIERDIYRYMYIHMYVCMYKPAGCYYIGKRGQRRPPLVVISNKDNKPKTNDIITIITIITITGMIAK